MKLPALKFARNEHEPGLNATVRLGIKWNDRVGLGSRVALCDLEGRQTGEGTVRLVLVAPLDAIPRSLLDLEHEPESREREALRQRLETLYDQPVPADSLVTLITYEVQP